MNTVIEEKAVGSFGKTLVASGPIIHFLEGASLLIGSVVSIAGILILFYFKHREDKRKQEEHDFKMKCLNRDLNINENYD